MQNQKLTLQVAGGGCGDDGCGVGSGCCGDGCGEMIGIFGCGCGVCNDRCGEMIDFGLFGIIGNGQMDK